MIDERGLSFVGVSATAESDIKAGVFADKIDHNLDDSDYGIEALDQASGSILIRATTSTKIEQRIFLDSPQIGREVADWLRSMHPPRVLEVFEGGPYSIR
jgi:hypothetical protein